MSKTTLVIGALSWSQHQARILAHATNEAPIEKNSPKAYFPTLKAAGEFLGEKNIQLLQIIAKQKPKSVSELARISGRAQPNVTRTLRKMEQLGLIEMTPEGRALKPEAKANRLRVEAIFDLT